MTNAARGLFSSDFSMYLNRVPVIARHFHSVRAIDELPRTLPVRHFVIVNLSPRHHSGSHWLVILRSQKDTIEIFNSLGFQNLAQIRPYLNFNFRTHLTYNNTAFQLSSSSSCGLYCIYYVVFRLLNLDMDFEEVLDEIFCSNKVENENKVAKFCQHLLNISNESDLYDF